MMNELKAKAYDLRQDTLDIIMAGGGGHIGGDMSVMETMVALYCCQMNISPENMDDPDRDRFVMSKGHCMETYYAVLCDRGFLDLEDVKARFSKFGSPYIGHPNNKLPGIEMNSGSLGHGLPVSVGMALAGKMDGRDYRVYTVMGDGELAEGSVWEAAMNAAHYKLGNLAAIIDCNGFEADGRIDELTAINDLGDKYRAFGWNVCEFDGNDIGEIKYRFDSLPPPRSEKPTVLICRTVKGKGVPFMENEQKWHAGKITPEQFKECEALLLRDWRQP